MLNNASGFRKVYIAAGYTDLRRGIDGLASIVKFNFQLDPYEKDILFLFCGRRSDRIKGLVWCFLASNFPHFHRYDSLKSALYIHAVSKNINTFPKNQGRIRAAIAVEILDFTVMYR